MQPGQHDWEIECGATFREPIVWKDGEGEIVDLNDYVGRMEIRDDVTSGSPALHTLTNGNGGIIPQLDGSVQLYISDTDTRLVGPGSHKYDLLFKHIETGDVIPLLKGRIKGVQLVTQDSP